MFGKSENSLRKVGQTIVRPCEPCRKEILATHWDSREVQFARVPGVEYEIYVTNPFDPDRNMLLADTEGKRRLRKITTFLEGGTLMEKIENDYPVPEADWKGLPIRDVFSPTGIRAPAPNNITRT